MPAGSSVLKRQKERNGECFSTCSWRSAVSDLAADAEHSISADLASTCSSSSAIRFCASSRRSRCAPIASAASAAAAARPAASSAAAAAAAWAAALHGGTGGRRLRVCETRGPVGGGLCHTRRAQQQLALDGGNMAAQWRRRCNKRRLAAEWCRTRRALQRGRWPGRWPAARATRRRPGPRPAAAAARRPRP